MTSKVPRGDSRSASPGVTRTAHPRRRRSLSWRVSLFVALVVTVALFVMVAASGLAMRQWMVSQTDTDLQDRLRRATSQTGGPTQGDWGSGPQSGGAGVQSGESTGSSTTAAGEGVRSPSPGVSGPTPQSGVDSPSQGDQPGVPPGLDGPGSDEGSLQLIEREGVTTSGIVQDFTVVSLDEGDQAILLQVPTDGRGHTVSLSGAGRFRVVAADTDSGQVVIGQSLARTDNTIATLVWVGGLLALLIAGLAALTGRRWLGREIAPLGRVAATARRIGSLDLSNARLEPFERVDPASVEVGTEVGDVGQALNTMIDNVESALRERMLSEQRLRQFVADASHELRTPLASIQGYAQLLQRGSVDPESALSRIGSESRRMSALVEDMLLLARLDAGRELESVPVDPVPLVVDAVSDAHAAGPDHVWSLDIDEVASNCLVLGDEYALRQVLANLINNARVHTPAGTRVVVGVHALSATEVCILVADDGPGIPEDLRATVFDRFVRGDRSRTRSGAGSSGLGLSIVSTITTSLGGRVEMDTSEEGTTFRVFLPRVGGPGAEAQGADGPQG